MPCLDFAVYKVTCSLALKAGSISSWCYTPCSGGIMDLYHARPLGLTFFWQKKAAEVPQKAYHMQVQLHESISNIKGKYTPTPREYI